MIKTILFAAAFALFSFIGLNTTPAQACSICGCAGGAEHAHPHGEAKKPCEKTMAKKEPCEKTMGKKEPCEKTLGEKKPCCGKCSSGKPCSKKMHKAGNDTYINQTPISAAPRSSYNEKGSLVLKSNQSFSSRATGQYNN